MGARTRRDTTRTFDTMSWQQQILMGEFNERGLRRSEEEASGEQGSSSRRVRRAAGTSNSWATGAPDTLTAGGAGSNEGKYLQSKDWTEVSSEAADWGTGANKYWAEAGKSRGGASVGGVGWSVMRGNMGRAVEVDGNVRENGKIGEVACNGVVRQSEERQRRRRNGNEQTDNNGISVLATWC